MLPQKKQVDQWQNVVGGASNASTVAANEERAVVIYALRYFWRAARGYRLRPWRSPYLRWRMETFFGVHADELTRGEFFRLLWHERRRMRSFLTWAHAMEQGARTGSRYRKGVGG